MNGKTVTFDKAQPKDFQLRISVGDEYSEDGQTRMLIDGEGNITVENHKAMADKAGKTEKPHVYTGKCHHHDPANLLERATQLRWDIKFPPRPGIPDEAIVIWEFGKKQGDTMRMKAWLRDAEKDPVMGALLKQLRDELSDLSDNTIYL